MPKPVFRSGQTILFIGDSITDAFRTLPGSAPYGNGYVSMVRDFMTALHPELELRYVNRGVGGDTVTDLAARWSEDVIAERPDWISVCIGINDVWTRITSMTSTAADAGSYEALLGNLLRDAVESLRPAGLVLIDPYVIEPDPEDVFRAAMAPYLDAVRRLAERFSAIHVRTQEAFDAALVHRPSGFWAEDRIHPEGPGHAVIALAFLRAVGAL